MTPPFPPDLAPRLLAWYDHGARRLPWRYRPGQPVDPYRVWLSEVMLQQTTVRAVIPYFEAFLVRWPTVEALAEAPVEDVMHAWAGLGYYARARKLHECAKMVVAWRGGAFPQEEEALRQLPGIGDYTAAAIAAIAFGRKATVVDGNVERVLARMFAVTTPLPAAKPFLRDLAERLTPDQRCGDYAQAVMDLGATLCTPRSPACGLCPWMDACEGRKQGKEKDLPAKLAKPTKPTRHGLAFWTLRKDGAVLIRRRPAQGLLGGMMEIPSTSWRDDTPWSLEEATPEAPLSLKTWRLLPGLVTQSFTHFHLEMKVAFGKGGANPIVNGLWCPLDQLEEHALPTIMRKIVRHALSRGY